MPNESSHVKHHSSCIRPTLDRDGAIAKVGLADQAVDEDWLTPLAHLLGLLKHLLHLLWRLLAQPEALASIALSHLLIFAELQQKE